MPSKLLKLPPIDEESFDGDKQSVDVKDIPRCTHKDVKFVNGELRCPCGNSWMGTNLHELYKFFKQHTLQTSP